MALACSPDHSRGPDESCLALPASCTHCDHLQVFDELDKIGRSLTEEAQDGGFPVHDGKGDIRKCPYYADKLGRSWAMAELPHTCGTSLAALTVLSLFYQARQDPAVPITLPWPWRSSRWCSWCWRPASLWQRELRRGTSCDGKSGAWLRTVARGEARPVLFQTVPLLLVVSWPQGASKKIKGNPAVLAKTLCTPVMQAL